MRVFVRKIGLFILPFFILGLIEVFVLPHTFWTYRFWEGVSYQKDYLSFGKFYQNQSLEIFERGDLSNAADSVLYKKNSWISDFYGFRNDEFISDPDIILLGDSFIVGTGLDQGQILSEQLEVWFDKDSKVYNMAPVAFRTFDIMYKKGLIGKPEFIVFEFSEKFYPERFVPFLPGKFDAEKVLFKDWVNQNQLNLVWDKLNRAHWAYYFYDKLLGNQPNYPKVGGHYFYHGENYQPFNDQDLEHTLNSLKGYQDYCDELGVKLIVMPIPTKETVYYEAFDRSDFLWYLNTLHKSLDSIEIININVLEAMLAGEEEYYQKQDTHWNEKGVALAARLLKDEIERINYKIEK